MKKNNLIILIIGLIVFGISFWQYASTVESVGSLWDCGEFISCAYRLQVAHPPGAPLFMLVGRIFSLFAPETDKIAVYINMVSVVASALAVMFLYFTITILAKKIINKSEDDLSTDNLIAVVGAGVIGALCCSFMDTMWFSAVEGEVYASSMFFISITLWAVMKWDEQADEAHGNRWLVFAAYMIGLSIGVHLLSLLVIPAAVFIYYYKKFKPTTIGLIVAFFVGFIILGLVQIGVISYFTKIATLVDHLFVNTFRLPFNTGLIFTYILLFAGLIFAIYYAVKIKYADLQLAAICVLMIFVGFSSYIMVPLRAAANPPINMNNPKDAYSLLSYLNREQYGDRPLVMGPLYNAQPYDYKVEGKVYFRNDETKKYEVKGEKIGYEYHAEDKMLFPRMGPTNDGANAQALYQYWTDVQGEPTMGDNLKYFFKYQIGYMYWRYFMWNFAGRQNDYQGMPGTQKLNGDWLSGVSFIDDARLGSQKDLPYQITNQKGRNKFYLLPLILGIIGLVFTYKRSKEYAIVTTLLFITTGFMLIIYSNEPPREPRERDYALVGSFFAFCIWIGMAIPAIVEFIKSKAKALAVPAAVAVSVVCLGVPVLMAKQGWNDHNRHDRYMSRDFAYNYLVSCPKNAILFTQGDNDTYPLWYAQEIEGIRKDVRIVNLSLLGVDWYIDCLQRAANDAPPVPFVKTFTSDKYRGNNRDMIQVNENSGFAKPGEFYELSNIMDFVLSDDMKYKAQTNRGDAVNYLPTTNFRLTIDKNAVLKNNVVPEQYKDQIADVIDWQLGSNRIIKYDLAVLAMIAAQDWSRPICFANTVEDKYYQGLNQYMIQEGEIIRFIPVKFENNTQGFTTMNSDKSYDLVMNQYKYGGLDQHEMFVDENSARIMNTLKSVHFAVADDLVRNGRQADAAKVLDKVKKSFPYNNAPYYSPLNRFFNVLTVQWIDLYYRANDKEGAKEIKDLYIKDLKDCLRFYNLDNDYARRYVEAGDKKTAEDLVKRMEYLAIQYKDEDFMKQLHDNFPQIVQSASIDPQAVAPQQIFR
ncbi:MAG: DUF2723 domain-containing protein [Chitinophagales bacterium]|nr:DUF2723 domain-containing protein [Chitinophagales bacterium]